MIGADLLPSFLSGISAFLIFLLIYIVSKGHMGMGDTKYTAIIAFHFKFFFWLQSIILCSLIALIVSTTLLITKKIKRDTPIPFIPFLVSGWVIAHFLMH